ncbi:hypothetical protein HY375_01370 [Candidatus Berkelbacteria bacterium]|nr:hypothetical protein [Candidatus Berkelbacteria bacterium]
MEEQRISAEAFTEAFDTALDRAYDEEKARMDELGTRVGASSVRKEIVIRISLESMGLPSSVIVEGDLGLTRFRTEHMEPNGQKVFLGTLDLEGLTVEGDLDIRDLTFAGRGARLNLRNVSVEGDLYLVLLEIQRGNLVESGELYVDLEAAQVQGVGKLVGAIEGSLILVNTRFQTCLEQDDLEMVNEIWTNPSNAQLVALACPGIPVFQVRDVVRWRERLNERNGWPTDARG